MEQGALCMVTLANNKKNENGFVPVTFHNCTANHCPLIAIVCIACNYVFGGFILLTKARHID